MLDVKDYVENCERQLNYSKNQKHLQNDPTAVNSELVHNIIKGFENENLIRENVLDGLKKNFPGPHQFNTKPKI